MKTKRSAQRRSRSKAADDSLGAGPPRTPLRSNRRCASPPQPEGRGPQPAIRIVMMPRDVNPLGTIFGGLILSSIDLAGVVEAHRHSDRMLVTAAMHEVKFIAPVFVGDLVSFYTETARIGRTSITIRVTVEATRASTPHDIVRVTQAEVVYVAIDEAGKPIPVRADSGSSQRPRSPQPNG